MKTPESEIVDLDLTQAIERYAEMLPHEVREAIAAEWHDQIAVLLSEVFFKVRCDSCHETMDLVQVMRNNRDTAYFVPLYGCEGENP